MPIYQHITEETRNRFGRSEVVREEQLCELHFKEVYPDGVQPTTWKNGERTLVCSVITEKLGECTFCGLAPEFQPQELTRTNAKGVPVVKGTKERAWSK